MSKFRRLIPYVLRQWPALVLIGVLTVASPLVTALSPWPMKLLVDALTGAASPPAWVSTGLWHLRVESTPTSLVLVAAGASLALFLCGSLLESILSLTWTAAGQRMVYELAADLFQQLQRLSLLFHKRQTVGDSLSRLTGDSWSLYTLSEGLLIAPLQHGLTLATVAVFAWRLDPLLTVLSLSIAPVLAAAARYFGPRLKKRSQAQRQTEAQLTSVVHQTISSIPIVQIFATREQNTQRFRKLADGAVALAQRGVALKSAYGMVTGLGAAIGTALVLYVGARRVITGPLTPGGLLVFVAYLRTMQGAAQGLMQTHATAKTVEASVDRVVEILESDERIPERAGAAALPSPAPDAGHRIRFDNVTFGYESGRPVLHDIALDLAPGEIVALVGPTGAGKSTLASLIPRLFDPWQGRVCVGDCDIRDVSLQSLRNQIAVVPQEPFLLPLTIHQNIAFGVPGASRADVERAALAAGAAEFIARLPDGYETVLGERGATLSVGQRQRLAIARGILKHAGIVILDEPTSALDAATEHNVMQAIESLMRGRTGIIIAHRLSTVRHAHRIVLLDQGRIAGTGGHHDLLRTSPLYASLCQAQARHPRGGGA